MKFASTLTALVLSVSSAMSADWTPISRTSILSGDGTGGLATPVVASGFQTTDLLLRSPSPGGSRVTQYYSTNSNTLTYRSQIDVYSTAGSPMQGIPGTWGSGGSKMTFRFSIASPVAYVLEGSELSWPITTSPPVALISLKNTTTNGSVVNNGGGGLADGPFSYTGLLAPGTYELEFDENSSGYAGASGTGYLNATFVIRENVQFSYPRSRPVFIPPQRAVPVYVNASSADAPPISGSGTIHYRLSGTTAFQSRSMAELSPNEYVGTLPSTLCGKTIEYYFSVKAANGVDVIEPAAAPATLFSTNVRQEAAVLYNSEDATGFTVISNGATSGVWENRKPVATPYGPSADYDGSGKAWVTDNRVGFDVDAIPVQLITPPFSLSSAFTATAAFKCWFNSSDPLALLKSEVSTDGGSTWTRLRVVPPSTNWRFYEENLAQYVPLAGNAILRFTAVDSGEGVTTEAAIDAIQFSKKHCTPGCIADFNADNTVDFTDFDDFVTLFEAGSAASDANGDGFLDYTDFDAFVASFEAGC